MVSSEAEKLFRAFAEERKRALPQFTPDGIPITLENKFDDAIYNYLYAYWKEQSGEYDPKKDVIPESEMNKMHPKTKNEFQFEKWLLQQYGMTNKEQREYTLKGNLESLWEIFSAADMVLFVRGLPSIGKELAQLGKKAVDDVAEEAIEKTVKKEASEEMAESTAKKEVTDTTEDLSQKTVDKDDSSVIKGRSNSIKPTQEGLDTIKEHLSGDMQADFNDAMIDRIENTLKKGGKLEGPDAEFYRHELEESRLMQQGLDYDTDHNAALDKYGVTEFDLYHPDVIKEMPEWFGLAWFEYWGISR